MLPISVVMITYNHEKYIGEAVQSILDQTFREFELIIINDGSADRTEEIIKNFDDDRIVYIYQKNQGPSAATNSGIVAAKGAYIALMSGDDICYSNRLERQYKYICQAGQSIIFSWADLIDDEGQYINYENFVTGFFNHVNRSRSEIFSRFFTHGNYLCAPSAVFKKDLCLKEGLFCLTSIQLQDFDMWLKFIKKYDIYILQEKLLKYRVRLQGRANLSGKINSVRTDFELCQIYKSFFDGVSIDFFKEAFSDVLRNPNFSSQAEYELEKAFLYLNHFLPHIRVIGATRLFELLQDKTTLSIAQNKYRFSLSELFTINKNLPLFQDQYELQELKRQISDMKESRFWKLREQSIKLRSAFIKWSV